MGAKPTAKPASAVTDPVVLSRIVDGVVLVIRSDSTLKEVARNTVAQLDGVGAYVYGAVLNAVDTGWDRYYRHYYYQNYDAYQGRGKTEGKKLRG